MNEYEVYIAVKKVQKPVIRTENSQGEPRKFTLEKAEILTNIDKLNQTDVPASPRNLFDEEGANVKSSKDDTKADKSTLGFSIFGRRNSKAGN